MDNFTKKETESAWLSEHLNYPMWFLEQHSTTYAAEMGMTKLCVQAVFLWVYVMYTCTYTCMCILYGKSCSTHQNQQHL